MQCFRFFNIKYFYVSKNNKHNITIKNRTLSFFYSTTCQRSDNLLLLHIEQCLLSKRSPRVCVYPGRVLTMMYGLLMTLMSHGVFWWRIKRRNNRFIILIGLIRNLKQFWTVRFPLGAMTRRIFGNFNVQLWCNYNAYYRWMSSGSTKFYFHWFRSYLYNV